MKTEAKEIEIETIYIQQHLANERTFLAWIRTSGAVLGLGFLAVGYHFEMNVGENQFADKIAFFIGVFSLLLSLLTTGFGINSYLTKRIGINQLTFRSSRKFLIIISIFMILLAFFYVIYLLAVYIPVL